MPASLEQSGGASEFLQVLPLGFAAALYLLRSHSLARGGRSVSAWRQASFYAGITLIAVAIASPVDRLADELVIAHMAQHLAIGDIAALLVVLGLEGAVLAPLLGVRAIDRLRILGHPVVALPLWALNLYLWHLPALYQEALASDPVHALQHGLFVGLGIAMWMPLVGPLPKPEWFGDGAKLIYIIVVRLTEALLANIFMWSGKIFYPDYLAGEQLWGISPLADQGTAGVVMLIEGNLLTVGLFAWLFFRAAARSEERQGLLELAAARGVAMDEARVRRAVAAGRGDQLRRRILEAARGQ